jgi:penicillin-binding protein 2
MESQLRGKNGVKTITTDADGNKSEEYTLMPEQGNTVILTIDRDLQMVAQKALAEGVKSLQISTDRS